MKRYTSIIVTMLTCHAEQTLEKTYREIPEELADMVLVVDGARKDRTVEVTQNLGLTLFGYPANLGYGGNQKTCYDEALRAGASVIVLLHPDHKYDPKRRTRLMAPLLGGGARCTRTGALSGRRRESDAAGAWLAMAPAASERCSEATARR